MPPLPDSSNVTQAEAGHGADFAPAIARLSEGLAEANLFLAGASDPMDAETRGIVQRRLHGILHADLGPQGAWLRQVAADLYEMLSPDRAHPPETQAEPPAEAAVDGAGDDLRPKTRSVPAVGALARVIGTIQQALALLRLDADGPPPAEMTAFLEADLRESVERLHQDSGAFNRKLESLRVLVADDEELIQLFFADLLRQQGHRVMTVSDGISAIRAIETGVFDLVFSDIKMPGASGIEVLKRATELKLDTIVVLVTGFSSLDNAIEAIRFGAYDYLTKPFKDTTGILVVIDRAAERLRLRRANHNLVLQIQQKNAALAQHAAGLEEALRNLDAKNRVLVHADRMATLGVLAAGVAHEINNPTTFIRGNLQTMEKFWETIRPTLEAALAREADPKLAFVAEEMPRLVEDMLIGTDRISRITAGLRSFARQEETDAGEEVDLRRVVADALQLANNRMKGVIAPEVDLPADLPPVPGRAQELTQVVLNLLINAVDALETVESPRLRIAAARLADGVRLEVEDNGPGIPKGIRERIFDPFFTTKGVDRGTGLGLSILLGIVRTHGGEVRVETPAGGGTRFAVFLPLEAEKRIGDHRPHVLLLDERNGGSDSLAAILADGGDFVLERLTTGAEGLARLGAGPVAALLLNAALPDMDAFEFLDRMGRELGADAPPVLALSSVPSPALRTRLLARGADEVVYKPCRADGVLHWVRRRFERSRSGKERD